MLRIALVVAMLAGGHVSPTLASAVFLTCDFGSGSDDYKIWLHDGEWAEVSDNGEYQELSWTMLGDVFHLFDQQESPERWVVSVNLEAMEALSRTDGVLTTSERCWRAFDPPADEDTTSTLICQMESGLLFNVELNAEAEPQELAQRGVITFEAKYSPRDVEWRDVGSATVLQNVSSGLVELAFDNETLEGWIPDTYGHTIGVQCGRGDI